MPRGQRKLHRLDPETGAEQRDCSTCAGWFPLTEFFLQGKFLSNKCKPCAREEARRRSNARYAADPSQAREYAQANADKIRARMAKWREANRKRLNEYQKAYNADRLDMMREYMRQKRITGEAQWYQREYARRFPDKAAEKTARYRAKAMGATVEPVDRNAIIKRDGRNCYLCAKFLKWREVTLDHVIPLHRGGKHTPANLRVCCGPCNYSKQDRLIATLPMAF